MRESAVESALVRETEARGGRALKFVSPGMGGVADRLLLRPVPPEHREIVQRYVKLVEIKAPGKQLRPLQQWFQREVQSLGHCCAVVDSREAVRALLE